MVLQEKEARLGNLLISYTYLAFDSAHILHSFLWSSTPRNVRQENLDKACHSCLSAVYKTDLPKDFGTISLYTFQQISPMYSKITQVECLFEDRVSIFLWIIIYMLHNKTNSYLHASIKITKANILHR